MTIEEMHSLTGSKLDGGADRTRGVHRRGKNRVTAHDGTIRRGQHVKTKVGGDGLRRGLIALLQAYDVRAGRANDFNAVAQAQPSLHPDVKAEDFELRDRCGAKLSDERDRERKGEQHGGNPGPTWCGETAILRRGVRLGHGYVEHFV